MKEDLKLKRGNLTNITIYGNRKRTGINRGKRKEGEGWRHVGSSVRVSRGLVWSVALSKESGAPFGC